MNNKKIFPLICFILLVVAIIMTTYFKNLEKKVAQENAKIERENNNQGLITDDEN
ncbi:hypothetical protein K0B03_01500 [Patescibacteria group bacterium]|nr:hypothetical protein [Patescibacteria group bacterium]